MKFYYTFGTDEHYPFKGGWAEVEAEDIKEAHRIFRYYIPDRTRGFLHCADYYTERQFKATGMMETGNFGAFCHCKMSAFSFEAFSPIKREVAVV